jgi:hypothetical protein
MSTGNHNLNISELIISKKSKDFLSTGNHNFIDISNINNWNINQWLLFEQVVQKSAKIVENYNDEATKSSMKDYEWDIATKNADILWHNANKQMKNEIFINFNLKSRIDIIYNIASEFVNIWNTNWNNSYITKREWINIAIWAIKKDYKIYKNQDRYNLGMAIQYKFKLHTK